MDLSLSEWHQTHSFRRSIHTQISKLTNRPTESIIGKTMRIQSPFICRTKLIDYKQPNFRHQFNCIVDQFILHFPSNQFGKTHVHDIDVNRFDHLK